MFSTDEKGDSSLIGEAAIRLVLSKKEIVVETLIGELCIMAETEPDDTRLLLMHITRRWLKSFCN